MGYRERDEIIDDNRAFLFDHFKDRHPQLGTLKRHIRIKPIRLLETLIDIRNLFLSEFDINGIFMTRSISCEDKNRFAAKTARTDIGGNVQIRIPYFFKFGEDLFLPVDESRLFKILIIGIIIQ